MRLHPSSASAGRTPAAALAASLSAVLSVALLAACSPDDDEPTGPAPSGTTSAPASDDPTDGATDADAPLTAQQACAAMYVEGDTPLERRIGNALVAVSEGLDQTTAGEMTTVGIQLGSLSTRVPEEFDDAVAQVRVPFLQLQETMDAGTEESVSLDIASAREGLTAYRELCDAAGDTSGS